MNFYSIEQSFLFLFLNAQQVIDKNNPVFLPQKRQKTCLKKMQKLAKCKHLFCQLLFECFASFAVKDSNFSPDFSKFYFFKISSN